MTKTFKISVLGDGGWGTGLAVVNARRKNDVLLWSAFPNYAEVLKEKRENIKFLPGIPLPPEIRITSDLSQAVAFADILILAIPAQYLRNILYKLKDLPVANKIFVSVAKGLEKKTCLRPSEIIQAILGKETRVVVVSGPSHAAEVARGIPTLVVAASSNENDAGLVQSAIADTYFRVYVQTDVLGVELGGVLKNVIAIAAGVSDGLGFGDNTKSGLISRGLLEMVRLGIRMGANPNTFYGLSGLGDLITTSFSPHGRNLLVGRELGKGRKLGEILQSMEMVAEGVHSAASVYALGQKYGLDLPIVREVYKMVLEDKDPKQAVLDLLNRPAYQELKQY
ncbi:MAG: NAD(P)-dependent glycerol-3-phosphate dehydrogenase [Candidatus Omnitrophica bacterium]|nr:NAD(P)-dependent glycerol-3-phosphate dehydrogenase [Candidatus Omnitrophota bacterium]MDD5671864.1 NAD(P)-dependent glycerol-3-phosphate dehydrogenase [Candidatus Omnitrophota bacterium]